MRMLSCFSCVFVTQWTVVCQAPLSMEFSRQEYWSGLPCPPAGDLPNSRIYSRSPTLQVYSLLLSHQGQLLSSEGDSTQKPSLMTKKVWENFCL